MNTGTVKEDAVAPSALNDELDAKISKAKLDLARILKNFNGSENHKEIRKLRRRVLNKLQKQKDAITNNEIVLCERRPAQPEGGAW